jgi:hypothetical protein
LKLIGSSARALAQLPPILRRQKRIAQREASPWSAMTEVFAFGRDSFLLRRDGLYCWQSTLFRANKV